MTIQFSEADIARGRTLVQNISDNQYALGALADSIDTSYGDDSLGDFADAIGIDYNTLKGYRYVWRRWKDFPVKPRTFSLAKALASFKGRDWYIEKWPNETEEQAREDIRRWKKEERDRKERETLDSERKGTTKKIDRLVKLIIKTADAFFSNDPGNKDNGALETLRKYYGGRVSWQDYSDMWDALQAARGRARAAMDTLDVIIEPAAEAATARETRETEVAAEAATAREAARNEREQVIRPIPFRKGEADDDI